MGPHPQRSVGSLVIVKKKIIKIIYKGKRYFCASTIYIQYGPLLKGPPFVGLCGIFWTKLCDSR